MQALFPNPHGQEGPYTTLPEMGEERFRRTVADAACVGKDAGSVHYDAPKSQTADRGPAVWGVLKRPFTVCNRLIFPSQSRSPARRRDARGRRFPSGLCWP